MGRVSGRRGMKYEEIAESIAKRGHVPCSCGFLEGFKWDGKTHKKCCRAFVVKEITQALAQVESQTVTKCIKIAQESCGECDAPFFIKKHFKGGKS
jgi:hypothetical protein